MTNEIAEYKSKNLAAEVGDEAIKSLAAQRLALNAFIKSQLKVDIDFGTIPNTSKPTLLKPGAEKIANIFQLGSKIASSNTHIDHDKKFILCEYTIELIHLPTGKSIVQCQGSVNSLEKKYSRQDPYSILNTLQKMAQKRAFVGAVIQACNASDFFTQDLEDMSPDNFDKKPAEKSNGKAPAIGWGKYKGASVEEAYDADGEKFLSYCDWAIQNGQSDPSKAKFATEAKEWKEYLQIKMTSDSGLAVSNGKLPF